MKIKYSLIAVILAAIGFLGTFSNDKAVADDYMRGVWVTTVGNLDYPRTPSKEPALLKVQAEEILDSCVELGFNTVFFQVRPMGDALYLSSLFPSSAYLTGTQGDAPYDGFDTLKYWVWAAHKRGIKLHAWINPYRLTKGDITINNLSDDNVAKTQGEYVVTDGDGALYLNPAMAEVRDIIVKGVEELADNYDIDGIHLDDYFYPQGGIDDSKDYEKYNSENLSLEDWRRSNCDALVKAIWKTAKKKKIVFGISPSGIWANKSDNPLGSDTHGMESYTSLYADTRKWALEEWVDYIAPQVYWEIGNSAADYATVVNWWHDTLKDSKTKLYIGIPDYKCADAKEDSPFYGGRAIEEQLQFNRDKDRVDGEIHFRYGSVTENNALKEIITKYNKDA